MSLDAMLQFGGAAVALAAGGPWAGKAAFIAVFALVLVWLLLVPGRLIGQTGARPPWWRNTRVWAILVAAVQILVYLRWG